MNKKAILILIILLSILILTGYTLFQISKSRTFQFFGGLTARINTNQKVVALTFDDAPTEYTSEVLYILAEKNIKATFYAIGQAIEKNPKEAKAIADAGMEIGNHSYSHQRFLLKSQSHIDFEIQKTNQLIRDTGYKGEITFRPPNGKKLFGLPWYLTRNNIETIMWDVEPDTYYPGNVKSITNYTIQNTKPGSIILLHPFCGSACEADRKALPEIVDGLTAKGYKFVTINQLLEYEKSKE